MKKRLFFSLMAAVGTLSSSAFAHHHGNLGTVGALSEETEILHSQVHAAPNLSWPAQNAVFTYVTDERYLVQCAQQLGALYQYGVPYQCRGYLDRARADFNSVDYYLNDATDFPYVYSAYQETREALYSIP